MRKEFKNIDIDEIKSKIISKPNYPSMIMTKINKNKTSNDIIKHESGEITSFEEINKIFLYDVVLVVSNLFLKNEAIKTYYITHLKQNQLTKKDYALHKIKKFMFLIYMREILNVDDWLDFEKVKNLDIEYEDIKPKKIQIIFIHHNLVNLARFYLPRSDVHNLYKDDYDEYYIDYAV